MNWQLYHLGIAPVIRKLSLIDYQQAAATLLRWHHHDVASPLPSRRHVAVEQILLEQRLKRFYYRHSSIDYSTLTFLIDSITLTVQ